MTKPVIRTECLARALAVLLVASPASADAVGDDLQITALTRPGAAPSHGKALLSYELRVTNRSDTAVILRSVAIDVPATRRLLARFLDQDLLGRTINLETGRPQTRVAPGETVLIYIDFSEAQAPGRLAHDISYEQEGKDAKHVIIQVAPRPGLAILEAPFRSGTWVAVHQPDWARGHRRVLVGAGPARTIPGRFAIDFVGVDDAGHVTRGDPDRPADAIGYGEPVLAGADAIVSAVRGDMAESGSISNNPGHTGSDGAGNYVALKLADGRYAFYEHLRPGSIRVKAGQRVRRSQQIGELGFSGDSTGPHLHLHVADGPDPARAEGLPFAIARFDELGRYPRIEDLGRIPWQVGSRVVRREWPGYNVVVRFD